MWLIIFITILFGKFQSLCVFFNQLVKEPFGLEFGKCWMLFLFAILIVEFREKLSTEIDFLLFFFEYVL